MSHSSNHCKRLWWHDLSDHKMIEFYVNWKRFYRTAHIYTKWWRPIHNSGRSVVGIMCDSNWTRQKAPALIRYMRYFMFEMEFSFRQKWIRQTEQSTRNICTGLLRVQLKERGYTINAITFSQTVDWDNKWCKFMVKTKKERAPKIKEWRILFRHSHERMLCVCVCRCVYTRDEFEVNR